MMVARKMRLARFLAKAGLGSRRACESFIESGRVQINGERITTPAVNVDNAMDKIHFDGKPVTLSGNKYVKLFKPPGYTCSAKDEHAGRLVYELVPEHLGRLFTVGRLDRDSEGLILLTNDGDFAQLLMHPRHQVPKTYHVWCSGKVTGETISFLASGVLDEGEFLQPTAVALLRECKHDTVLEIILQEGRKREVRRLCHRAGLEVIRLRRVAIAELELGELEPGQWRELNPTELKNLQTAAK